MNVPFNIKVSWIALRNMFTGYYTANKCGHRTKLEGMTESFGHKYLIRMPKTENGNPDHCLACIGKMAIRCTWCGEPIYIGDPVTLYGAKETFVVPAHAVKYGTSQFVGCLGWNCALTGCDRMGFWYPPGEVYRVPSPIEMALAGNGDNMVIINNLGSPNDLGTVIPKSDL